MRGIPRIWVVLLLAALLGGAGGCSDDGAGGERGLPVEAEPDAAAESDAAWEAEAAGEGPEEIEWPTGPFHDPWLVRGTVDVAGPRGWQVKHGIIHCHSPYSHDACDDEPFPDGVRDEQCFEDLRAGMCETLQDFVFLTDHRGTYADHEYPDVILYKDGDVLIERDGRPVANRVVCPGGHEVIVTAGTESGMMPIGLERHVADTPAERSHIYGLEDNAAIDRYHEVGGLVYLQHTEGWEVEEILELNIDGLEVYNLHQNLMDNMLAAIEMMIDMVEFPWKVPVPELAVVSVFQENERDLLRWSKALMEKRMPVIVATDVHRNAFQGDAGDGERLDSFRRLMHWFSNYVLVPAGPVDDAVLKAAIEHGRMYGAFEYLGYPEGFDFHGEDVVGAVFEMGDEAAPGVELRLALPRVYKLDPRGPQPVIRGRILRANDGEWDEVAEGQTDLTHTATTPGAYRAEVRIVPEHLREWLSEEPDRFIQDWIWIYSNVIYVGQ